ncbi:MAG: hypothetical protein R3D78_04515 [Paracoccaceae bacterium]
MSRQMLALSFGFAALIAAMQAAEASSVACGARAAIVEQLAARYQERRRAVALAADNSVLEIFAADSGSWTILVTRAEGPTCLIASGEAFEFLSEELPARGTAL